MNKVYYSQADSRWANFPYPSKTYPKATIKSSGCGPTSASMIISSMVKTIYPNEMAKIFLDNGLRASTGTSHEAFKFIADKYGLKMKKSIYINDGVECLKKGGMVVAYCKAGGLFSTGGHIIVLAGIEGNNLIVYDPYLYKNKFNSGNRKCVKVEGNKVIVSVTNFKKYCDYTLYCYEKEKPDIIYEAHIQDIGWQKPKSNGQVAGTEGQEKRIEAIKINCDIPIKYRVHMAEKGWSNWKSNNETAGTIGESRRIEAIEIIAEKPIKGQAHVQNEGWQKEQIGSPIILGTTGKSLRLEAFKLEFV